MPQWVELLLIIQLLQSPKITLAIPASTFRKCQKDAYTQPYFQIFYASFMFFSLAYYVVPGEVTGYLFY